MLDRAISNDARLRGSVYYRAQLHQRVNQFTAAMKDLARILALNPKNTVVERELRLCEQRARKPSAEIKAVRGDSSSQGLRTSSGLFKNLLKK